MPNPIDLRTERLKRLPVDPKDTWQGAIVKVPAWVTEPDTPPVRPCAAVWISLRTGIAHIGRNDRPEHVDFAAMFEALVGFAQDERKAGNRPGRVEVQDPDLAEFLQNHLRGAGIETMAVERLEAVEGFMATMTEELAGPDAASSLLEACGGDIERVGFFAEAAAAFYEARPWVHLDDHDLIHVESSAPGGDLKWLTVMGVASLEHGLAFHPSKRSYATMMRGHRPTLDGSTRWSVTFDPITELSFPDADLWEDQELPRASEDAYPHPAGFLLDPEKPQLRRPDAKRLAYFEAVLRALADTTEDELDSGRWSKRVTAAGRERTVKLALPSLLDPPPVLHSETPDRRVFERISRATAKLMQDREFESLDEMNAFLQENLVGGTPEAQSETDQELAQELVYQAVEARGRRQIKLAREAIALDPDCADAYVLLAERMPDLDQRTELYQQGVAAGERTLGADAFEEDAGEFWGILETRPYMRARLGLAQCLEAKEQLDEALLHYRELLRLNPGDNQGVRYLLATCLLRAARDDEAEAFLEAQDEEVVAFLPWTRALVAFRREGASGEAAGRLGLALERNRFVSHLLLGKDAMPEQRPDHYAPGSFEEAVLYCEAQMESWEQTPGAIGWLRNHVRETKRRRQETRKKGKQKRTRRKAKRGRG